MPRGALAMYEESQGDPRVHWSMHAALQHVAYIEQHEDLLHIVYIVQFVQL